MKHAIVKRISFFLLFLLCIVSVQAQSKFRFGLGFNCPIPIEEGGNINSHISLYLNASYRLTDRINVDFGVHSENYTTNDDGQDISSYSLAIVPGANYLFPLKTKKVLPYVGLGAGISFDSYGNGLFGPTMRVHPVLVPKVGIQFFKHLDVTFRYYITHPDYDRLMVGIGYTF